MVTHASRALIQLVNQARVALGLSRLQRLPDWETFYSSPPHRRRVPRYPFDAAGAYVEDPQHPSHLPSGVHFEDSCPIARAFPVATPGDNPVWCVCRADWFPDEEDDNPPPAWTIRFPTDAQAAAVASVWHMPRFCSYCEEEYGEHSGDPCEKNEVRVPDLMARWLDKHAAREYHVSLRPLSWTRCGPVYFEPAVLTEP
jgi:hypothetical protein